MAFFITKPEDFTNKRARAIFMTFANAFHGGDVQAAIAEHNQNMIELEKNEKLQSFGQQPTANEINLRFAKH